MTEKYTDSLKQAIWESYWEGYMAGKGVESYTKSHEKTAQMLFERWWDLHHDDSDPVTIDQDELDEILAEATGVRIRSHPYLREINWRA